MERITRAACVLWLVLAPACGGGGGEEDAGDMPDIVPEADVSDVPVEQDVVDVAGDPDAMDIPEVHDIHDPPADTPPDTPVHPDDCAEVTYFQCGFNAWCGAGVIHAEWHEHVFHDDVEDIVGYTCSHECEFGCLEGTISDWPPSGADLVADWCLASPPEEPGTDV